MMTAIMSVTIVTAAGVLGSASPSLAMNTLTRLFERTLSKGHLVHCESDAISYITDGEHRFQVKFCPALLRRFQNETSTNDNDGGNARVGRNPFDPPDPTCLIADDIRPAHNLLFNKYCVTRLHLLLTTKAYKSQEEPLEHSDFVAAADAIHRYQDGNWLLFYNSGPLSGASQPHRHLQLIPLTEEEPLPVKDLPSFAQTFPCHFRLLSHSAHDIDGVGVEGMADVWYSTYQQLWGECRNIGDCSSTNLLFTPDWMLLVRRTRAYVPSTSSLLSSSLASSPLATLSTSWKPNSLIFAGYLLAKNAEEMLLIENMRPLHIIRLLTT
jgi:ATP adenylyltransferase